MSLTLPTLVFYYLLLTLETLPANLPPFNCDLCASSFRTQEGLLSWVFPFGNLFLVTCCNQRILRTACTFCFHIRIKSTGKLPTSSSPPPPPTWLLFTFAISRPNEQKQKIDSFSYDRKWQQQQIKLENHCSSPSLAWSPDVQHIKPFPVAEVNRPWDGHVSSCSPVFQSS